MVEGRCHKCKKWIPLESVKEGDAKVKLYMPGLAVHFSLGTVIGYGTLLVRALVASCASTLTLHRWKHAAACHQGSIIEGESDVYVTDAIHLDITKDL